MSYDYQTEKKTIFTEENQKLFLSIRDNVRKLCKLAGCVRAEEAIRAGVSGSSWVMLACLDRMVELGELREIIPPTPHVGQYRIFMLNDFE